MIPMSLTKEGSSIQIERMLINDSLRKKTYGNRNFKGKYYRCN